jgi:hypothetical protein
MYVCTVSPELGQGTSVVQRARSQEEQTLCVATGGGGGRDVRRSWQTRTKEEVYATQCLKVA